MVLDGWTNENHYSNSKKIYYNVLLSLLQSQNFVTVLLLTELDLGGETSSSPGWYSSLSVLLIMHMGHSLYTSS